jgi:predicted restriction endonuclease
VVNEKKMLTSKQVSQSELILSYFKENPRREIPHVEVVDWAVKEYKNLTGKVLRDPDRAIRKLSETYLIKVKKGVYKYDPDFQPRISELNFTETVKKAIFERDNFRCVICNRGEKEGVAIQADHILPRFSGGKSTLANGQTLCAQHNFQKKNLMPMDYGKRLFEIWMATAEVQGDFPLAQLYKEIIDSINKYIAKTASNCEN